VAFSRIYDFFYRTGEGRGLDPLVAVRELESHGFRPMPTLHNVFVLEGPGWRIQVHLLAAGGMAQHEHDGKLKIKTGSLDQVLEFVRPLLAPDGAKPRAGAAAALRRRLAAFAGPRFARLALERAMAGSDAHDEHPDMGPPRRRKNRTATAQ
jgi:hypothetical protein